MTIDARDPTIGGYTPHNYAKLFGYSERLDVTSIETDLTRSRAR